MDQVGGKPRDWLLFFLLLVVGAFLGNDSGVVSGPVSVAIRSVFVPVQSVVGSAWTGVADFAGGVLSRPASRHEAERLREEAASARALRARINELELENRRLRETFDTLRDLPGDPLPARVLAYYPLTMSATLSAGSRDGVEVGAPVVSPRGLVGVVESVDAATCRILFNISDRFSAGGRVTREDSRASGIVRGSGTSLLMFEHLSEDADVQPGDEVVTSGLGRVYPKGLLIGTVEQVWRDPTYTFLRASVRPAARHDTLEEVIILR